MHKESEGNKWFAILVLGICAIIFLTEFATNYVNAQCSITGIDYIDVRPRSCYGNFDSTHCPVPKNIDCRIKGSLTGIEKFMSNS